MKKKFISLTEVRTADLIHDLIRKNDELDSSTTAADLEMS